ncbi:MAG: ABC transporter permease subunit [Planctomycetes bacterium]|nr:ABC transporter permease subunit [Planctomycetota bacterium]
MNGFKSVFKRELKSYFSTPLAYVFLVIFLVLSTFLTFKAGFFDSRHASMQLFFSNLPELFIFLVPAIAMRLWAEERKSNSIELLFSLPITTIQAVLGKFVAAWAMLILALALTFPMVWTVAYLGNPDWGPIWTGYAASILLAGAYLAISSFFSALTRNQVIAFVLAVVFCMVFLYASSPTALDFLTGRMPVGVMEAIESLSFQSRFESMQRGVLEVRDLAFFLLLGGGWLWANVVILEERRGQ